MSKEYDVGYGKPPTKHQFKKGKSGNPSGRPKFPKPNPPLDPKKILIAALKSPIPIKENGKKKIITKMEAFMKSLVLDALNGDKAAKKFLIDFLMKQDKYAFEDEGTIFFRTKEYGEIKITKEEQKERDQILKKLDEYAELLDADSDQEQRNGSPSSPGPAAGSGNAPTDA